MAKKKGLFLAELQGLDKIEEGEDQLKAPDAPEKPTGDVKIQDKTEAVKYTVPEIEGTDEYRWVLIPEESGNLTQDRNNASVLFNEEYEGTATLKVKALNRKGESKFSQGLSIEVEKEENTAPLPVPEQTSVAGKTSAFLGSGEQRFTAKDVGTGIYEWSVEPSSSAVLSTKGRSAEVLFKSEGTFYIKARAVNEKGEGSWSEGFTVKVTKPEAKTNDKASDTKKNTKEESKSGEKNERASQEDSGKKSLDNNNTTTLNIHLSISNAIDRMRIFTSSYTTRKNAKRLFVERIIVEAFEKQFGSEEAEKLKQSTGYPDYFDD